MYYNGDVLFAVSDVEDIIVNFENEILPTKVVKKGDVIALGKRAPKNRWMYQKTFDNEKEYILKLTEFVERLYEKKEYVKQLKERYHDVSISIYIRSDYGQLGYSLPNSIIKKMGEIGCDVYFDILSFGQVL